MTQPMFPCGIPKAGQARCPKHGFPIDCEKTIRANREAESKAQTAAPPEEPKPTVPEPAPTLETSAGETTLPPTESVPNALKELRTEAKKKKSNDEGK